MVRPPCAFWSLSHTHVLSRPKSVNIKFPGFIFMAAIRTTTERLMKDPVSHLLIVVGLHRLILRLLRRFPYQVFPFSQKCSNKRRRGWKGVEKNRRLCNQPPHRPPTLYTQLQQIGFTLFIYFSGALWWILFLLPTEFPPFSTGLYWIDTLFDSSTNFLFVHLSFIKLRRKMFQ